MVSPGAALLRRAVFLYGPMDPSKRVLRLSFAYGPTFERRRGLVIAPGCSTLEVGMMQRSISTLDFGSVAVWGPRPRRRRCSLVSRSAPGVSRCSNLRLEVEPAASLGMELSAARRTRCRAPSLTHRRPKRQQIWRRARPACRPRLRQCICVGQHTAVLAVYGENRRKSGRQLSTTWAAPNKASDRRPGAEP
jgi:hypothetical protein